MAGLLGIAPEELALIGGLLSGKKGENWGQHFMQLAAAQDAKKRREQQEMLMKQQMEQGALGMEQTRLQMDASRRQLAEQDALRQAFQRNVTPGQPQMLPTDMETPSGPAGPSSFNMGALQQDLMRMGPAGLPHLASLVGMNAKNHIKLGKDETLIDANNPNRVLARGAPDLPTGMRMGPNGPEYIPSYLEGQKGIRSAGASNTVVRLPQPEKAILKVDEERLGELSTAASSARRFAQTSSIINRLLEGKGGGTMIKVGTETARALGLKGDTIAANDLAESLNTRLATEVRAPGSGSTSNIEFEAYRAAVPSLKNSEAGRRLMTEVAVKFAERNAKLADYGRSLIRAGKFSDEAIAQYDEKLGSVLGDDLKRQFSSVAPVTQSGGGLTPEEQRELQELRAKVGRR
jgi:hypothetical protein